MYLLIPSLLCCGLVCTLVSADPSPQWLYEQIHALPVSDNDQVTAELHTKKSDIPEHKKRKDGVKRLFSFLDSAIQDSGSGSGEGSAKEDVTATEEHSSSTGLTDNQLNKHEGPTQQGAINSNGSAKQGTNEKSNNNAQAIVHAVKTNLSGYGQQGLPNSSTQSTQLVNQYTATRQQGLQTGYFTPQRTAGYRAFTGPYRTTTAAYSTNNFAYARSMQRGQSTAYGYPVTGQRQPLIGHTVLRTRPPAIPVRSQVTGNNLWRPQQSAASSQRFAGGSHRSNIQTPYSVTTIVGPNQYGSYSFVTTQSVPGRADEKSAEPLQEKPYGQPKRQRDQFHQQTRALIPDRVPGRAYSRYPYPPPAANFRGGVRAAIQPHFPYQYANPLALRTRMPGSRYIMASAPSLSNQIYYRHLIPQRPANLAFTARMMREHGYPLVTQKPVVRALINRKPQPRNFLTSLTAAAERLVVPARSQAYKNL